MAYSLSALDSGPLSPPPPVLADDLGGAVSGGIAPVLLVEDDRHIQRSVTYQLHRQGYRVTCCDDGESGLEEALQHRYSVVVLDVMLPKLDGLTLCKQLRQARRDLPIIIISARGSDLDKITGLEFGADDYLAKPFSPAELEARIRALRRRSEGSQTAAAELIRVGRELVLDCDRHQLRVGATEIRLTPKEMALLRLLMSAPGRIFTRENLLAQAWGFSYDGYHRAVDAHFSRLKAKLQEHLGEPPSWLKAVYGVGYRVCDPDSVNPDGE
ncbi:MAG TPA: response regulator transcription factor [Terriglobales bacterium]|nr:response regulator transcription factor [Terriglobales bacterium]